MDFLKCKYCEKDLCKADEVVSIIARKYLVNDFTFMNLYNVESNSAIPREINFHVACFKQFAGKDYLP